MSAKPISDAGYVKAILKKRFGVDITSYKDEFVERRLRSRMLATSCKDVASYVRLIGEKPEELNRLLDSLRVNVSSFFRDAHVWSRYSSLVFEPLVREKAGVRGAVRVLSAGCSCGEEAYSISITLEELFKKVGFRVPYTVLGIDVDEEALAQALKATYDEGSLSSAPRRLVLEYFEPSDGGRLKVKDAVREHVKFVKMDLRQYRHPEDFDVVFCRNVLIYFSSLSKEAVVKALVDSLKPKGYLVLGLTEFLNEKLHRLLKVVDPSAKIYQKAA